MSHPEKRRSRGSRGSRGSRDESCRTRFLSSFVPVPSHESTLFCTPSTTCHPRTSLPPCCPRGTFTPLHSPPKYVDELPALLLVTTLVPEPQLCLPHVEHQDGSSCRELSVFSDTPGAIGSHLCPLLPRERKTNPPATPQPTYIFTRTPDPAPDVVFCCRGVLETLSGANTRFWCTQRHQKHLAMLPPLQQQECTRKNKNNKVPRRDMPCPPRS
jgi:hypothetical protein